ncbi:MAG: hypothetical protein K2Q04_06390 [Hyphomicrobium sp.]|nr:hypothetical protein [Hyphomicrobium sp.]
MFHAAANTISDFGKFERDERSAFLLEQVIEASVTRNVVCRVACEPAPPLLSDLALDEGDQLFPPFCASVSEIFWPGR